MSVAYAGLVTITVLVPTEMGLAALADVDGVRPLRYQPGEPLPPGGEKATVLVPGFLSGDEVTRLLDDLPDLDYIQLLTAGAERWINIVPPNVKLSICRGAHGGSTAEWVIGALLYIYREFGPFARALDEGEWVHDRVTSGGTDTLQDKRVLIVGAGDLGEQLTRRLVTFDASATLVGRQARDGVHGMAELPDLLGDHDAVVLMVPLTTETTGMVDAAFLARMADGAILVNAARGPVVDTDALVAELNSGRLRAALDVTDPEPLPAGHPLWTAQGLFLIPARRRQLPGLGRALLARRGRRDRPLRGGRGTEEPGPRRVLTTRRGPGVINLAPGPHPPGARLSPDWAVQVKIRPPNNLARVMRITYGAHREYSRRVQRQQVLRRRGALQL